MKTIKLHLPWKTKGFDGKYYQATLKIIYDNTQDDELIKNAPNLHQKKPNPITKTKT